ncbi:hypothetical protein A2379_00225 [Candidatus Amesbacteria bacterium RIFOXYB1_FULL_47_13]|nr:MAG: hypothetical protein A2379_00225 [Candidatus Amesbacteria bacterium RIFOXYB1_FULL_47_13]HBC72248.1 hypothetical protein [Candidatus Amesbacteria bacterium]
MDSVPSPHVAHLIRDGFLRGIGWAFGVTLGFVAVSTTLVILLKSAGGLPLIGSWIADIVETTQAQLSKRNPYLR